MWELLHGPLNSVSEVGELLCWSQEFLMVVLRAGLVNGDGAGGKKGRKEEGGQGGKGRGRKGRGGEGGEREEGEREGRER